MHFSTFVLSALALASSAAALAIKPQQNLESGLAARDTQDCLRYFYPESSVVVDDDGHACDKFKKRCEKKKGQAECFNLDSHRGPDMSRAQAMCIKTATRGPNKGFEINISRKVAKKAGLQQTSGEAWINTKSKRQCPKPAKVAQ